MSQNIIAPKIKHRVRLCVRSRGGGALLFDKTTTTSSNRPLPSLSTSTFLREKKVEQLCSKIPLTTIDADFEAYYAMAMEKKKALDERDTMRKQKLLVQQNLTEIHQLHRLSLLSYENILVQSFLRSFIIKMNQKTRKNVLERVYQYKVDPTVFDLGSFQKLLYQTNHLLSFLDVHNEEETYYGVFRLFKRNLYRFWYRMGMKHLYNLDYHWDTILKDLCHEHDVIDNGKKDLEEGIENLKKNKKKEEAEAKEEVKEEICCEHTCGFLNAPPSDNNLEKQNQKMWEKLRKSYFFYLNSPDTIVVV